MHGAVIVALIRIWGHGIRSEQRETDLERRVGRLENGHGVRK